MVEDGTNDEGRGDDYQSVQEWEMELEEYLAWTINRDKIAAQFEG